jgi:hypothetical protein
MEVAGGRDLFWREGRWGVGYRMGFEEMIGEWCLVGGGVLWGGLGRLGDGCVYICMVCRWRGVKVFGRGGRFCWWWDRRG